MAEYDDPLASRAAFAERFKSTGNLDQRRRFAQDISSAKAREEERDTAAFETLQRKDPQLMNAVTARSKERRMGREGEAKLGQAERRIDDAQSRFERLQSLREDQFKLNEESKADGCSD